MPRMVNPRRSNRDRISPDRPRACASGLIITNVRSRSATARAPGRTAGGEAYASVVVLPVTTSRVRGGEGGVPVTAVSQYGQRRHSGSSGLLQRRQAFFSLVPQWGQERKLGSAGF